MAIDDLWTRRDGTPTKRHGRGRRWRVRVPGYPATLHRTKAEAEAVNAERIVTGPPHARPDPPVTDLLDRWLAGKASLSPKGIEAATLAAAHVRARWGGYVSSQVQAGDVQAWIASLPASSPDGTSRAASASLKHKVIQCLRGSLHGFVDLGMVRVPKEQRREARYLDVDEVRKLAEAMDSNTDAQLIWTLATTGMRIGEACALNVGDVDPRRRRIRVHKSKTGLGRDIPITSSVISMLDVSGRSNRDPLFTGSRGQRLDVRVWRRHHFKPAAQQAELIGVRPHDLRHTAASWAIAAGADVKAVQRMLGHASATMTLDLYGHLWDQGLDAVADRLDAFIVPHAFD